MVFHNMLSILYFYFMGRVHPSNGFLFIFWARNFIFGIHMYFRSNKKKMPKKIWPPDGGHFGRILVKIGSILRARALTFVVYSILVRFHLFWNNCSKSKKKFFVSKKNLYCLKKLNMLLRTNIPKINETGYWLAKLRIKWAGARNIDPILTKILQKWPPSGFELFLAFISYLT